MLIRKLEVEGHDYSKERSAYLYEGNRSRLTLANECQQIFIDLLTTGQASDEPQTGHQKRLVEACGIFKKHVEARFAEKGIDYLRELFAAITSKLVFTTYPIEEECEIGMTFELMNSRGEPLSTLELLKNYFMHWVSRNLADTPDQGSGLTAQLNQRWKTTYANVGDCDGNEDQVLRVAWILMCSPTPKHWNGYRGFKDDAYFPLRGFEKNGNAKKSQIHRKIQVFADLLATNSKHYLAILDPNESRSFSTEESSWLGRIGRTGNIANILPLMVSARMKCEADQNLHGDYIELLKSLERYAYRVYIFEGKRSNAGRPNFFRKAYDLHNDQCRISEITESVDALTHYYAPEDAFREQVRKPFKWYNFRRLLKYTLFEYEAHRLEQLKYRRAPQLKWSDLSDTTIEHVLPQTPAEGSQWLQDWNQDEIETWLHDIGNLSLTLDNSCYSNFHFERKKGAAGKVKCYAGSPLIQERDLAAFDAWTADSVKNRHESLTEWVVQRWGISKSLTMLIAEALAEDEEEPAEL